MKNIYENIVSGIDEEIFLISRDYKIVWANKLAIEKYGPNILDRYCYDVTHGLNFPCQGPFDPCPMSEVLATGKASSTAGATRSGAWRSGATC